jgi:hypothetical protein
MGTTTIMISASPYKDYDDALELAESNMAERRNLKGCALNARWADRWCSHILLDVPCAAVREDDELQEAIRVCWWLPGRGIESDGDPVIGDFHTLGEAWAVVSEILANDRTCPLVLSRIK